MSAYSAAILASSPVTYYRLGESSGTVAADSSGGSTDGTYVGAPTLGATGALSGDPNTAVTFDGATQYMTLGASLEDYFNTRTAFSLECWVKFTDAGDGPYQVWGNDSVNIVISGGGIFGSAGVTTFIGTGALKNDGNWHYVALTFDGTRLRLYIDGGLDDNQLCAGPGVSVGASLAVAADDLSGSQTEFFPGSVDEAALYSTTLSQGAITTHYSIGKNGPPSAGTGRGFRCFGGAVV